MPDQLKLNEMTTVELHAFLKTMKPLVRTPEQRRKDAAFLQTALKKYEDSLPPDDVARREAAWFDNGPLEIPI